MRTRSRVSNLPRDKCRCRDGSSPPSEIASLFARKSSTTARIAAALARKASERGSSEAAMVVIGEPYRLGCFAPLFDIQIVKFNAASRS